MSQPVEEINSFPEDPGTKQERPDINWNRIYIFVLLFNGVLISLFYLLSHFVNHHGI